MLRPFQARGAVGSCDRLSVAEFQCPYGHRLFSAISHNWASRHLDGCEPIFNYIRTTMPRTGLRVTAVRVKRQYRTGGEISKEQMAGLMLQRNKSLPRWHYDLLLRVASAPANPMSAALRN